MNKGEKMLSFLNVALVSVKHVPAFCVEEKKLLLVVQRARVIFPKQI